MERLRLAVMGWGHLGQACVQAMDHSPDLVLAGVVRRTESLAGTSTRLPRGVACVPHVRGLDAIDAVLLCVPAEAAPAMARELLHARMPLVDCAILQGHALQHHHDEVAHLALRLRTRAVVGAGWVPGVLPQLQHLFELLIPKGRSQVTRRVGASVHHTAAAQGIAGVRGAL